LHENSFLKTGGNCLLRKKAFLSLLLVALTCGSWGMGFGLANDGAYDLAVYGATAGGVATAVAAERQGLKVLLISPDAHTGGMVTGGLSSSDKGNAGVIGGISREFFERVGKHYGEPLEWYFEPHIADQVFHEMLTEAKVELLLNARLKEKGGVSKRNGRIIAITLESGRVVHAGIFADCTYEGDLMAQAGVSYAWGRESSAQYGESLAGVVGRQRPDHHFNVRVSAYAADGSLLPEVQPGPKGAFGSGDKKVQAYSFRMCLTNNASNQIPFPKPEGYDAHRYEVLRRLIQAITEAQGRPPTMKQVMIVSPLKGGKVDINSFGAFSTDHVGASWGYPTAGYAQQAAIWQDHFSYVAGFFYFLAHDPSVPQSLQNEINGYGLAKDEFTDTHGWPWQLYIRESRRLLGEYVVTQKDIQTELTKPDSIGMGSYQSDSHNVERIPTPDGALENEGEMYTPTKPYEIPYRFLLPRRADKVVNLLVPVCFSASHVAYSTLRMEPQYMIIGQAAGVAAAIAKENKTDIYRVPIPELQQRLLAAHAILHQ
jgi:FAD dependent oxidoreductase